MRWSADVDHNPDAFHSGRSLRIMLDAHVAGIQAIEEKSGIRLDKRASNVQRESRESHRKLMAEREGFEPSKGF
jgi:hypothetical protein